VNRGLAVLEACFCSLRYPVICVARPAFQCFTTLSHTGQDFRGGRGGIEQNVGFFSLSATSD